jgi:hypothetical protein
MVAGGVVAGGLTTTQMAGSKGTEWGVRGAECGVGSAECWVLSAEVLSAEWGCN